MAADLFRQEALDYWSRQRGPGAVLRITTPWVRWLYWIVLALVVAGLALTFLIRIDQRTSGPALVNPQERTFVAVLPAVAGSDLQGGRPLRLEVEGPSGWRDVPARVLRAGTAQDADILQAGFGSYPQPAILVTGVLDPDIADRAGMSPAPRLTGRAVVVLGSEPVFSVLLHGFGGASEKGNS